MRPGRSTLLVAAGLAVALACEQGAEPTASRPGPDPDPSPATARPAVTDDRASPDTTTTGASLVEPIAERCPASMALVDQRFCIDRWEAILVGADRTQHSPYHAVGAEKLFAEARAGVVPQAYISMEEADDACKRTGRRLCTTQQWVDACMGSRRPKRRHPWGNAERRGACNTEQGGAHPLMALHQGSRKTDSWSMNDPRINQLASTVAPTGAFPECTTPDGVHDLVGNLLEWTRGERPLLMGGHYLDARENGEGCAYVTQRHGPKYHDFTTGFRCCSEPGPASGVVTRGQALELTPASAAQSSTLATSHDVAPSAAETRPPSRDPAGQRSFDDPGARLPPLPKPPPYEPANAACPVDMALVDGQRCTAPEQQCLRWLEVPGQEAQRACAEFAKPSRCSSGTRHMRYCIDRYEYTPPGWQLPLVHVSWSEAQNLCRAQEKRLCLEDEWEFACEGPDALPYPYGHVRDGAACNHDLDDLFGPGGKLRDRRVARDALPRCQSPFGVFNLVGNVDEWTTRVNREPPWRSILRGGWWLTGRNRCRAATESHNEIYAGPQTSFRCCKGAKK